MNINNFLIGIYIIIIGLILDIIIFFNIKKIGSFGEILILMFLTNIIANIFWMVIPEFIMPHCLGCMLNDGSTGKYIWDKNNIRNITVLINSIYGILLTIYTSHIIDIQKKDLKMVIVTILIIIFMGLLCCSVNYM